MEAHGTTVGNGIDVFHKGKIIVSIVENKDTGTVFVYTFGKPNFQIMPCGDNENVVIFQKDINVEIKNY